MSLRDLPARYVAAVVGILLLGALWTLTWLGVPPFDNITVFILTNVFGLIAVIVLGVLGGAFVGLVLAHRIFSTREFSPFERAVVERLNEIKDRQTALEQKVDELRREAGVRAKEK